MSYLEAEIHDRKVFSDQATDWKRKKEYHESLGRNCSTCNDFECKNNKNKKGVN